MSEGPEARLSIVLNAARFAQSALRMMRRSGSWPDERELNQWLATYVHAAPDKANPADLARRPLASAAMEMIRAEGAPERVQGRLRVRLAFQYDQRSVEAIEFRLPVSEPPPAA